MTNPTRDDRGSVEPQPRGARKRGGRPIDQAEAAERFLAAPLHQRQHDNRLWTLRERRDGEMWAIPEWEDLRALASAIKEHTLSRLDAYLEIFEAKAKANGVVVHWAKDAAEHNRPERSGSVGDRTKAHDPPGWSSSAMSRSMGRRSRPTPRSTRR